MICEQEAESFKWRCRTDIEDKPGRYVPVSGLGLYSQN